MCAKVLTKVTVYPILHIMYAAISFGQASAAQPEFYPNQKYNSSTVSQLNADINSCTSLARSHTGNQSGTVLRKGVGAAARGAALGAIGGAIAGNTGRGAGAGAAMAGTVGVVSGVRERGDGNPEFQRYATFCLEDKGYKILGWK